MQTITTYREARGVIVGALDDPPPNEPPEPPKQDDLYEINSDFSEDLLWDGGGEALAELVKMYSATVGSSLGLHDVPVIEFDCNQSELDESGSGQEAESGPEEESGETTVGAKDSEPANQADTDRAETSGVWGKPLPRQPDFQMGETEIEIQGVGVFRHGSGQPIQLRAYPYMRPKTAPPSRKQLQAYREQDHYNSAWTYVHGT